HLRKDGTKRRYKLAYFLMVHGKPTTLASIQTLVAELDDGSAIFLIHVDDRAESRQLKQDIKEWIVQRENALKEVKVAVKNSFDGNDVAGNVFLTKTSYQISWGHGSIMWMQMNGFWELLELAEWDHLINLSANDYPLRKSKDIARILSQPEMEGYNFIDYWTVDTALAKRLLPHLHIKHPKSLEITGFHLNEMGMMSPPFPRWEYVKNHQWVILTRKFVDFTRRSDTVALALAYFEHILASF
ncbi:hypothetical protein HDU98_010607, partial [Podochytrium sp. JEL0797]